MTRNEALAKAKGFLLGVFQVRKLELRASLARQGLAAERIETLLAELDVEEEAARARLLAAVGQEFDALTKEGAAR